MKDIIQVSASDRWSNNLQKRAPYTLRSALFSVRVFTHTSTIWSPHLLSWASNKCWFTSNMFAKNLLTRKMTSFSFLRPLQSMTPGRHLINDCSLGYSLGCYKRCLLGTKNGELQLNLFWGCMYWGEFGKITQFSFSWSILIWIKAACATSIFWLNTA